METALKYHENKKFCSVQGFAFSGSTILLVVAAVVDVCVFQL
jgi:hypothetical protein